MLQNFYSSVSAVLPMIISIALGILLKNKKIIDDDTIKKVNLIAFNVFFPCMIFNSMYWIEDKNVINPKLFIIFTIVIIIALIIGLSTSLKAENDSKTRGAMLQIFLRSNFMVLGFPILRSLYGEEGIAVASLLIILVIPLTNILTVSELSIFGNGKLSFTRLFKDIFSNIQIMSSFAGLFAVLVDLKLPIAFENLITSFSNAGTPVALLMLGASINLNGIKEKKKDIAICTIMRLVILPLMAVVIGLLAGLRGMEYLMLIVFFAVASPTACYTLAMIMDSDYKFTANCVAISSAICPFTLFLFIFFSKCLHLM